MKKFFALAFLFAVCVLTAPAQQRAAASAGELFVDVSAADYLQVVDLGTRRVVDKIVVGMHPHGLAVTRRVVAGKSHDLLLVTVEETGELVVVDARSHKILGRVAVGEKPNELTVTKDGKFAYVPLQGESKVAIVELGVEPAAKANPQAGSNGASFS
ncbi:MAG TPA: hypothetical protein VGQ11_06245, partial [Candidatus Acidoferrales bacterium]|nr:hypothetical protein [Candidatus Acidoferrales bacterium]